MLIIADRNRCNFVKRETIAASLWRFSWQRRLIERTSGAVDRSENALIP